MTKNAQIRWDDLTVMLAVIDHGSVAAAARALEINHATVLRRIAEFETRTGVRMFDKTTRGYQVSPDRRDVIEAMRSAAESLGNVERLIDHARPSLDGGIRITTTDSLAQFVLPPLLPGLIEATGAAVEIAVDNSHIDLLRARAHLTIRPTLALPPEIDGLVAGAVHFHLYGPDTGKAANWLGLTGPLSRSMAAKWLAEQTPAPRLYGDSFLALAAMAAEGLGNTVLPSYVAAAWPKLKRIDDLNDIAPVPVWVGAHVDYAQSRHIRQARRHLATALAASPMLSPAA